MSADTTAQTVVDVDLDSAVPCWIDRCDAAATFLVRTRCCRSTYTLCTEHLLAFADNLRIASHTMRARGKAGFECDCGFRRPGPATLSDLYTVESIR